MGRRCDGIIEGELIPNKVVFFYTDSIEMQNTV